MPTIAYKKRIITGTTGSPATTTVVSTNCYVQQITIVTADAGTAWTLRIQDKDSTPAVLIPEWTLAVPVDGYPNIHFGGLNFQALPMIGGIDIITRGTTPGAVTVWLVLIQ